MIYVIIAILIFMLIMFFLSIFNSHSILLKLYRKYMNINNAENMSGKNIAFLAKRAFNLDVKIAKTKGLLTDGYSSKSKIIIISEEVCNNTSIAAAAIVAHEVGHAVQHKNNSLLFILNRFLKKICKMFCFFALPLFLVGAILYWCEFNIKLGYILIIIALILLALNILQNLLEIPLEQNASKIGFNFLKDYGIISIKNAKKVKKLLNVASKTYMADFFKQIIPIKRRKE